MKRRLTPFLRHTRRGRPEFCSREIEAPDRSLQGGDSTKKADIEELCKELLCSLMKGGVALKEDDTKPPPLGFV